MCIVTYKNGPAGYAKTGSLTLLKWNNLENFPAHQLEKNLHAVGDYARE